MNCSFRMLQEFSSVIGSALYCSCGIARHILIFQSIYFQVLSEVLFCLQVVSAQNLQTTRNCIENTPSNCQRWSTRFSRATLLSITMSISARLTGHFARNWNWIMHYFYGFPSRNAGAVFHPPLLADRCNPLLLTRIDLLLIKLSSHKYPRQISTFVLYICTYCFNKMLETVANCANSG
jgi:hypothetical protein